MINKEGKRELPLWCHQSQISQAYLKAAKLGESDKLTKIHQKILLTDTAAPLS